MHIKLALISTLVTGLMAVGSQVATADAGGIANAIAVLCPPGVLQ